MGRRGTGKGVQSVGFSSLGDRDSVCRLACRVNLDYDSSHDCDYKCGLENDHDHDSECSANIGV